MSLAPPGAGDREKLLSMSKFLSNPGPAPRFSRPEPSKVESRSEGPATMELASKLARCVDQSRVGTGHIPGASANPTRGWGIYLERGPIARREGAYIRTISQSHTRMGRIPGASANPAQGRGIYPERGAIARRDRAYTRIVSRSHTGMGRIIEAPANRTKGQDMYPVRQPIA
eukprot:1183017-Prorocentrum_minimum.AAC.2